MKALNYESGWHTAVLSYNILVMYVCEKSVVNVLKFKLAIQFRKIVRLSIKHEYLVTSIVPAVSMLAIQKVFGNLCPEQLLLIL